VLTGLTGQKFIRVNGLPQEWTLKSVVLNGTDVTDSALEFRGSTENPVSRSSSPTRSVM
jgi:hypothetical protein